MDEKLGLWLYGVIENSGSFSIETMGINGSEKVYTIEGRRYTAVVSRELMKKYPLERSILIAHQKVNEQIMEREPVLPVRFATLALDEDQIKNEVLNNEDRMKEFKDAFSLVRDKKEYGLRARLKDLEGTFKEISEKNEKVITAKENALNERGEKKHLALIEVGHVVKAALEEKKTILISEFMEVLKPLSTKYKHNNVLGDMNIFNGAFLVADERQELFDSTINELTSRYEKDISFKYVGPTPAYNFVEIVIHFDEKKGA